MLHAASRTDALVSSENHERFETVIACPIRIGQTVVERMLAREERHDARARDIGTKIDHEMPKVVFFLQSDGAIGEKHERSRPRETPDRVVGIDPRVAAGGRLELGARRTELRGDDARTRAQLGDECVHEGVRKATCDRRQEDPQLY